MLRRQDIKKELCIVSHTHWDREWYLSHAKHNYRMVKFFDALIEAMEKNERFLYFHLDGQIVIIEDYLAVRPEMEEKVRKFIPDGRWGIGPFYILQDEYLINGESSVRNALYGMRVCNKYGKHYNFFSDIQREVIRKADNRSYLRYNGNRFFLYIKVK